MIAAKAFDPVLGVDIHIIQPPGPVPPVPVPHPFVGMLIDPMDFAPVIGATVMVNGMPRATAGTGGQCIPPHIPIGGVFVKPPANECEVFMGSSTVLADGDPLSFLGMPALSCHDVGMPPPPRVKKKRKPKSLALPTSVVLAVPMGPPVLVGGPPTISMMALGMKAAMAGLGKAFKKLKKLQKASKKMKALSDKVHNAAKKAMDKLGVPPSVQNKVHRGICSVTGHPVDVATGKVFTEAVDFELPGPIAFRFERVWYSCSVYDGPLGHGWHHNYDLALLVSEDGSSLALRMADGRPLALPALPEGGSHFDRTERLTLLRDWRGYALRDARGLTYRFATLPGGDATQRLATIENRAGDRIEFAYDSLGRLAGITDSARRHLSVHLDAAGRITAIVAPHPDSPGQSFVAVAYGYDERGELVEVRDALGQPARYQYEGRLLVRETDRNGFSYYFTYEGAAPLARCVRTWGDGGLFGRSLRYEPGLTTVVDSLGHTTSYYPDVNGRVVRKVDPLGGETLTEFGDANEVLQQTDALGHVTAYEYDERGNCVGVTRADGSTYAWSYDAEDHMLSAVGPAGGKWQWAYDAEGRASRRSDPLGQATSYDYEGHRPVRIEDAAGRHTRIEYADTGLVSGLTFADGSARRWAYDALGRQVKAIDQRGRVKQREFDLLGRITRIVEPDGSSRGYEYDGEGNLVRVSETGRVLEFAFAPTGRLAARIDGASRVEFRYDSEGRLVGVRNEHGDEYLLELDANGRITAETSFDGARRTYVRDELGRLLRVVRPSGSTTDYRYDPLGRITRAIHSDGRWESYRYRPDGALLEVATPGGAVRLERDLLGRATLERQGEHWLATEYDALGTRTGLSSSLGARQSFRRTLMGSPDRIAFATSGDPGTDREIRLVYDALGLEVERWLPGSIVGRLERDALGRPTRQHVRRAATTLFQQGYAWDANAQLASVQEEGRGTDSYEYDPVGQLIAAHYADGGHELRLADAVGNLFRSTDRTDRRYGPAGQLLAARSRKGTTRYQYDADGRLVKKVTPGGTWSYRWTVNGFLAEAVRPDGTAATFDYDGLGRRISKRYAGRETRWLWDGNNLLHEWVQQAGGTPRSRLVTWVHQPDTGTPLAKVADGRAFAIITDCSGSPAALFDEAGRQVWSARLDIYGGLGRLAGERGAMPFRFPGQYEDGETGLFYNRFRYYDPDVGGYLSPDPLGLLGGHRLYAYVPDPFTAADPLGLSAQACNPDDTVSLYHGSINDASHIRQHGLDPGRTPTWVSRDRAAAENALSNNRYEVSCGDARDPGIIESRVPREEFDRVFQPSERDYSGFGGGMDSSEVVLRNEEQVETFNRYIVREGG